MRKQLLAISAITLLLTSTNAQTILGIDVSQYQGTITWSSVKNTSHKEFAWAKATEGTTITDPDFVTNETNGVTAGVAMGAYHFADPENNTATAEANYFLSVAGSYIKAGCAPPALDLEDPPSGPALSSAFTSAQLTAWVQTWMSTVQSATGIAPVIYTDGNYAAYLSSSLSTYGLWIADPDGSATAPPATTGSWSTWEFKQYSWTGAVSGISGNVDMDVYNGDTAAFKKTVGSNTLTVNFTASVRTGCQGMSVNYTDKSTSTGTLNAWRWEFQGGTPSSSKVQNPSGIVYNTPGTYYVKEVVNSTTGHDSVTVMGYITVIATATLPLVEGFQEAFFPPAGWVLHLPSPTDSVWEHCTHTGSGSSECMYFPANCGNVSNITGERQQLYTPDYSFASATSPKMWFDVAYEPSKVPTYSDTLNIYYSLDCGNTWTMIYSKGGATLCTTGGSTSAGTDTVGGHGCFLPPNSKAWRTDSVNISALAGKSSAMFSFESRSGWGNIIYLDNINIIPIKPTAVPELSTDESVKVYPNPFKQSFTVDYSLAKEETVNMYLVDIFGRQIPVHSAENEAAGAHTITIDCNSMNLAKGMYVLQLQTSSGNSFFKVIAQ